VLRAPLPRPSAAYLFSAKGAVSCQPGATPQENAQSQDRGLKARPIILAIDLPPAINRTFGALDCKRHASRGVAPGWNSDAPLALNTHSPAGRDHAELLSRLGTMNRRDWSAGGPPAPSEEAANLAGEPPALRWVGS